MQHSVTELDWHLGSMSAAVGPDVPAIVGLQRVLGPEELAQIQDDLAFLRLNGPGSAGAELVSAFDQLGKSIASCLASWVIGDAQPLKSERDGVQTLTGYVGQKLAVFSGCFPAGGPETVAALSAGQFAYAYARAEDRVSVTLTIGDHAGEPMALLGPLRDVAVTQALMDLLADEERIRASVTRLRELVAPVLDGAPALIRLDHSGTQPELRPILFDDASICLTNLRNAHALAARGSAASAPPTPVDETDAVPVNEAGTVSSQTGAQRAQPVASHDHVAGSSQVADDQLAGGEDRTQDGSDQPPPPAEFFDGGLMELALLINGLLSSLTPLSDRWSARLREAADGFPEDSSDFNTHISALLSMTVRLVRQIDDYLVTPVGLTTRLPGFPQRCRCWQCRSQPRLMTNAMSQ